MSEQSTSRSIREKVVVAVLSAVILWFLSRIVVKVPEIWTYSVRGLNWFFEKNIQTPLWLLCILSLAALIVAALILLLVFQKKSESSEPSWNDYRKDFFHGMIWRWSYSASQKIQNVAAYCPRDDTILVYGYGRYDRETIFQCETCKQVFDPIQGDHDNALGVIERQIDRKLRTGEWKQVVLSATQSASVLQKK